MGMAAEGMAAEGGEAEGGEASDCAAAAPTEPADGTRGGTRGGAASIPFVSHRIYDLPDNPPVKDRTVKSSTVHVFTVEPALAELLNQGAATVAMPMPTPMPSPYHPTTSPPHYLNARRVILAGAADGVA